MNDVITQFLVIPQNSLFKKNKIKLNKGWQYEESMLGNTAAMLEEIQDLIVLHYAQKLRKKCKFKVNYILDKFA
jgi:hypothetical protein